MDIVIGPFDPDTRTVPVTFAHNGVTHQRAVNAVLDEESAFDEEGTATRVDEVARGVAYKIELGVLVNAPPAPALPEETEQPE